MTSWIIGIAAPRQHHWDIAKQHGFWDMTRSTKIERGDHVFFWLSGKSLVSHVLATADATAIAADAATPWEDSGLRTYTHRFHFRTISDKTRLQPKWDVLQQQTGVRGATNLGPRKVPGQPGEAWLAAQFFSGSGTPVDIHIPDRLRVEIEEKLGEDLRDRAQRTIALRQGQPEFRVRLLKAYGGACAVTGYTTEEVLEAAHIAPYKGVHTNDVTNGLLLRADIHTLFDRFLITVASDYTVRVAPVLAGTPYAEFEGRPLHVLPNKGRMPSTAALAIHHKECAWLAGLISVR